MYKLEIVTSKKDNTQEHFILYTELNEDIDTLRNFAKVFFDDKANVNSIRYVFEPDYVVIVITELNEKTGNWDAVFTSVEYV